MKLCLTCQKVIADPRNSSETDVCVCDTQKEKPLILNEDYYLNEKGLMVFTEKYHLKRGYCCNSGCQQCPYRVKF